MNEITMIPVGLLEHHPENPRKDLGDLTELTASIKKNGIMQNLTVIADPETSKYLVVIGNRRLEAAKAAGLIQLPCVVKDLDHKTQIATMLEENMNRQDLTVYEQAQGFQMMMDLGYTAKEIGEKTGFSEKTVKDRIKFTKFNQKNFEKAVQQGATLMDMIEISKLESKSDQNEVMKYVGGENFRQKLKSALDQQENRRNQQRVTPILKEAGLEPMEEKDRWTYDKWRQCYGFGVQLKDDNEKFRKGLKKHLKENGGEAGEFRYYFTNYGSVEIYKKVTKETKQPMTEAEKSERKKAIERGRHLRYVKSFWAQAYELRKDFIKNYTVANGQGTSTLGKILVKYALNDTSMWSGRLADNHSWKDAYIREVLGLPEQPEEIPNEDPHAKSYEKKYKTIWQQAEERGVPAVRIMLAWIVGGGVFWPDDPEHGLYAWEDGAYENPSNRDNGVTALYRFLQEIGYQMSDMEKQLLDGTHECYKGGEQ